MRLEGKVCVITGARGGIGTASATVFEREGAHVVGVDLAPDAPEPVLDPRVHLAHLLLVGHVDLQRQLAGRIGREVHPHDMR